MASHELPSAVADHQAITDLRRTAAELLRQYDDRTGPLPGDPFDWDLWADDVKQLLVRVACDAR